VQGLGGFHLACDACNEGAIATLRARKHRPRKPLAVMLSTLAEVEKHALVSADERALLACEARPIVLLRRRDDSDLARNLAPDSPVVGALLAYTPLHRLLLGDFGGPLVMTSANLSGEPIAYSLEASRADLTRVADALLVHDREIVAACDDSVATVAASGPIWLRRSRGHAPRPIRLARPLRHTVLACGGQWSNAICIAHGDRAWLSAHIADMEAPASLERLDATVQRWLDWLGLRPDVVAHDLHPDYETTRYARAWPGAETIAVQHHHAHLAAVLAEHGHTGPAVGLVWDGTGYGGDGSAWGGELLIGDARDVRRIASFRPIPLAGGESAIRQPWRLSLAALDDAFDGTPPLEALDLFRSIGDERIAAVRRLLARPALCPPAHGVGRWFDAIAALLLVRPTASFQGELAQSLGFLASGRAATAYPFQLDTDTHPMSLDLRAAVRALTAELLDGRAPTRIADRFHATLVAAGALLPSHERPTLVLAGGCFGNRLLVQGFERDLAGRFRVLRAAELPPGDGGLALGQAVVADARAGRGG
jgi:hydrogenase maturation protein HypF